MIPVIPAKKNKKTTWPAVTVLNPGKGLNTLVSENMIADEESSDCKNVMMVEAGAIAKRNGRNPVGSGLTNNPKGLGSFYTVGGSKYLLTMDGSALKYLNGAAWTSISGVSFSPGNTLFTEAKGAMYIYNGLNAAAKLDSSLTLTTPTTTVSGSFAIFYSSRMIASGVATQPNRLYVSGTDPGDFTNTTPTGTGDYSIFDGTTHPGATTFSGTDANYIDLNKDDGDKITGLGKFQTFCIIFKERSIWQLSFDASGIPIIVQISASLGCVSHRSIDNLENDLWFLSRNGYYILGNQANFTTNIRTNEVSAPIHPIIDSITPLNLPNTASIASGYSYISSVSTGGTTTNNETLMWDRRYSGWVPWFKINANAFTEFIDANNKKHLYYAADDEAQVYEIDSTYTDNGVGIDAYWTSKAFDLGDFTLYKQFIDLDIQFRQLTGSVTIATIIDGNTTVSTKTLTTTQDLSGTVGSDEWGAYGVGGSVGLSTTLTTIAKNLIPNPNFEINATGWATFNGATIAPLSGNPHTGINSLVVITGGSGNQGAQTSLIGGLVAGLPYVLSIYAFIPAGITFSYEVDTYTAGSGFVGAHAGSVIGTGAWQRVSQNFTAEATVTQCQAFFFTGSATTFYIDDGQLEIGTIATPYFDGSLPATSTNVYAWSGTVGNSASTNTITTTVPANSTGIAQISSTSTGILTTNVPYRIHIGKNARTFKIKVSNSVNNQNFALLGFKIYFRPYDHQFFPSAQIIS